MEILACLLLLHELLPDSQASRQLFVSSLGAFSLSGWALG